MKNTSLHALSAATVALAAFFTACSPNASEQSGVEILFNGKDLTGWEGNPESWKVEDGLILGEANLEESLPHNQFLVYQGEPVEDFELTVELKLDSEKNNSGIQYRAQAHEKNEYGLVGYQCDVHAFPWAHGMVYDEQRRGLISKRGMQVVLPADGSKSRVIGDLPQEPVFETGVFNTYKVTAKGNHVIHEVNGVKTVEFWDHDPEKRSLSGSIGIQLHRGGPMKVAVRKVELKRLPKAELTAPEATPIPDDAPSANPPKKKPAPKPKKKPAPKPAQPQAAE